MSRVFPFAFLMALAVVFAAAAAPEPPGSAPAASEETAASAPADAVPKAPADVVNETTEKVLKVLEDPGYKDAQKRKDLREQIRSILLSVADMERISVLTLANYKSKFSDEQFKQFTETFSRLLFATYISNIEKYNGEKVLILETKEVGEARVMVKTKVTSDVKDIPIDYSLAQEEGQWKVYDIYVEGVSLVKNYRPQFREILLNKSAADFLARIEKKVKENEEKL